MSRDELNALREREELEQLREREKTERYDYSQGLLQTIAQGFTLGFGDEITAALAAVPASVKTGRPLDEVYGEILTDVRGNQQSFAADNPKTAFAAEMGGAVMTGGAGGAKMAGSKVLSAAKPLTRYAVAGAVPGAIYGAGATETDPDASFTENVVDRIGGAGMGAVTGAVVGMAVPVAGKAAAKGVQNVASKAKAAFKGAPTRSLRKINQAFVRDNVSPQQAQRKMAVLGKEASLADIGGANVRGLAEDAAQKPGQAMNQAERFLRGRLGGQRGRLIGLVKSKLSSQADDISQATDEIVTRMRTEAGPLYDKAYAAPFANNKTLNSILENPLVKPLIKRAIRNAKSDVDLPDALKAGLDPDNPNLVVWDYVKRELADRGYKAGGNQGRIYKGIEKRLIKELDGQVPDYGKARSVWSDNSKQLEALEQGQALFSDLRKDPDFAISQFKKLSEDQKELFRLGAGRKLISMMKNVDDTLEGTPPASLMKQIAGSPAKRDVLKAIFPDQKEYRQFMRELNAERVFHSNSNKMLANSRTSVRQALRDDADIDVSAAADVAEAARGGIGGITRTLRRLGQSFKNDPQMDKEMARRFFTNDAAAIKQTLIEMEQAGSMLPKNVQGLIRMKPPAMLKWLKNEQNRKALELAISGASGAAAA